MRGRDCIHVRTNAREGESLGGFDHMQTLMTQAVSIEQGKEDKFRPLELKEADESDGEQA